MIKFPENLRPKEAGKTNDPNYYLFNQNIWHPTKECCELKNRIEALIEASVLQLKEE